MPDGVHEHLAVVVRDDVVPLGREPRFQVVAIRDVAVVRAVDVDLAADLVRLRVEVVDGAERRPAHLAAEDRAAEADDAELLDHRGGRADALA